MNQIVIFILLQLIKSKSSNSFELYELLAIRHDNNVSVLKYTCPFSDMKYMKHPTSV